MFRDINLQSVVEGKNTFTVFDTNDLSTQTKNLVERKSLCDWHKEMAKNVAMVASAFGRSLLGNALVAFIQQRSTKASMKCLISVKIGVKLGVTGIHIHVAQEFHEDSMTDDGANEGAEGKMRISMDAEVNPSEWKTITGWREEVVHTEKKVDVGWHGAVFKMVTAMT